ncbi:PQQ-dependent sugar dehydrogenase [Ferrimonas marina]|uniref:Glucose/arabinose dehydrogenase, beta-propeller fold n=1 Tax=Ferrimonas marina TaxID=299255 RepID=A0A1M5X5K1_9GAMM|nr:PQQ-dependent sugar dehydrogenase [Ferrimonas marina]SHH95081.1 Glucose/arabinose dehydrogenase, beta-propeller fold [Ferrimonas marina]
MKKGILTALLATVSVGAAAVPAVEQAVLPPGFELEVYVDGVENARQMAWGDKGTLFVGSRRAGKVHAIIDSNQDGHPDKVTVLAEDLTLPSGLAFKDGALYVAAVSTIYRWSDIEAKLADKPKPEVVYDQLPEDIHHGWKYIDFAPDGRLVVPVGAPCNICDRELPYATILALDLETGEREVLAKGVRNSVGFDFHPQSGELYFSDNGRDHMGDDMPPCEINHLTEVGSHFGYPYWHGGVIEDPEYPIPASLKGKMVDPIAQLQAHVAPLGVHFYRGEQFPAPWRGALLIAEHGSWNRSSKVGYRISALTFDGSDNSGYTVLVDGWLDGEEALARPVAFLPHPDGSILISDDDKGRIYRLSYNGDNAGK